MPCQCSSKTKTPGRHCGKPVPMLFPALLCLCWCCQGAFLVACSCLPSCPTGMDSPLPFGSSLLQLLIEFALLFSCQLPPSSPCRCAEDFPALSALLPAELFSSASPGPASVPGGEGHQPCPPASGTRSAAKLR